MKYILCIYLMLQPFLVSSLASPTRPRGPIVFAKTTVQEDFLTSEFCDGELYLNLPEQLLERPMLFVRYDQSYRRKYIQVIWSLKGNKVLLKVPRVHSSSGIILPLKQMRSLRENILAIFPMEESSGESGEIRINITGLLLDQVIDWDANFKESLVSKISLVEGAKDFEGEVVIKTRRGVVHNGSKVAVPVFYGFCALPKPMKGRAYDYRMGFYDEQLGGIDHDNAKNSIANISRWRLEKKYPDRRMSVPIKPITFVLSPEIPEKWRPYIKAGIEEWIPAFEEAGFQRALVVKDLDSLSEWKAHSIRTSVVHWTDAKYLRGFEVAGGTVSNIVDERSGEILKSDIHLGSSLENREDSYFIRCAPLDHRARSFPFPDELSGELFQVLAAHETGHAFGLMDSNYGEFSYPYEKLGDSVWLKEMGHSPSVMNYTRANTVVQPEDSINPILLHPKVGPMDRYQIRWAYSEFPMGWSKLEEQTALERIVLLQDSIPWYRYNNSKFEIIGPAASDEVVETDDPVKSTEMALKNLERVLQLLPGAVKDQRDNGRLERLYEMTLELWYNHMRHVLSMVGGYDIQYKSINQPGKMYTPVPWDLQEEALVYVLDNAFNPPDWLINPEFQPKLKYSSYPDKMAEFQQRLVMELVRAQRLKRFEYLETLEGYSDSYHLFLVKTQKQLFEELYGNQNKVERGRAEIQLFYIDYLMAILGRKEENIYAQEKAFDYTGYSKGLLFGQLEMLGHDIENKLIRIKDEKVRGHWKLCLSKLEKMR